MGQYQTSVRPSVHHGTFRFLLTGSLFTRDSGSDGRKNSVEREPLSLLWLLLLLADFFSRKSPHRSDGQLTRRIFEALGKLATQKTRNFHAQTEFPICNTAHTRA
jgi:hypothetical protein